MIKPVIAVDIDDVLSRSAEGFAAYSNATWQSAITAQDYCEEWAIVWGTSIEEAKRRSLELHQSGAMGAYDHFEEAKPVLKKLKDRFDLVVVTSRREMVKPETDVWLRRHFDGVFAATHYAGMWDSDKSIVHMVNATKTDTCKLIGAQYLIDDQIKHCVNAAEAGISTLLFGDYTWNRVVQPLPQVTKVHKWSEVEEYFNGR